MKKWAAAVILGLVVAGIALLTQGDWFGLVVLLMFTFYIGGPVLLFIVVKLAMRSHRQQEIGAELGLLKAWLLTFAVLWAGVWLGKSIGDRKVERAMAYPAKIEPMLEAYRKETGSYPESLAAIRDLPAPPEELRYWGESDDNEFELHDQRRLMGVWYYESQRKEWVAD